MPNKINLQADLRKLSGRKVKTLRRQGIIPANVYGREIKSVSIQVPVKEFQAVLAKTGETGILDLTVAKEAKSRPVLVHQVQTHPVSGEFLHVDFRQVDLTKKIIVKVPVEVSGTAPAVAKGGVLIQLIHELEVEALPRDLPDKFTVAVIKLEEIGQGITLKEIKIDPKVKLMTEKLDELVVKIEEPTKEEVVAAPAPEAAAPAEGEASKPAEGEKKPEAKAVAEAKPEAKKEEPKK